MPHSKSAEKRVRQGEARRLRSKARQTETKTQVKSFLAAVEAGDREAAEKQYRLAEAYIDKASKAGLYHGNKAARMKSRLAARLNKIAAKGK